MGAYSVQFWGIDLTEAYDDIEKAMPSIPTNIADDEMITLGGNDFSALSEFVEHHKLGESHYDGGGFGQITYIGKSIGSTARGTTVTDDDVSEVDAIIARIPHELKAALVKIYGRVPDASFHSVEGWD